jgi:hypothetical protein
MNTKLIYLILLSFTLFLVFDRKCCSCDPSNIEHFSIYSKKCKYCKLEFKTTSKSPKKANKDKVDKDLAAHVKICSKNPSNITSPISSTPSTTTTQPSLIMSTDGRCGPNNNNTKCPIIAGNKTCCSMYGWCGGVQGGNDAWCNNGGKGIENGKYDYQL